MSLKIDHKILDDCLPLRCSLCAPPNLSSLLCIFAQMTGGRATHEGVTLDGVTLDGVIIELHVYQPNSTAHTQC